MLNTGGEITFPSQQSNIPSHS